MTREEAVARIRKLMRLARDGGATEGEVVNAMKAARALMDRFAVEEAEIATATGKQGFEDFVRVAGESRWSPFRDYEELFGVAVTHICDVGSARKTGCEVDANGELQNTYAAVFFGRPRNVAVAHELHQQLIASMRESAKRRLGMDHTGGYFSNVVGPLSTLGLIKRHRGVVALNADLVFPEGLR